MRIGLNLQNTENGYIANLKMPEEGHGFFSIVNKVIQEFLRADDPNQVVKIIAESPELFTSYRNDLTTDAWSLFFKPVNLNLKINKPKRIDTRVPKRRMVNQPQIRELLPVTSQIIEKYISPNETVLNRADKFIKDYNIDLDNTISMHYRGTDRHTEEFLTTPEYFALQAKKILQYDKNLKILIQSDQSDVTDYFNKIFSDRCFYFKELPQTNSKTEGVHVIQDYTDKLQYGIDYLASTIIISKCKYVITYEWNGGIWEAFYRGNLNNFYQP